MNDWEDRDSKAAKRRTIYEEMRESMRKIKEKVESEETIDRWVAQWAVGGVNFSEGEFFKKAFYFFAFLVEIFSPDLPSIDL